MAKIKENVPKSMHVQKDMQAEDMVVEIWHIDSVLRLIECNEHQADQKPLLTFPEKFSA